MFASPRGLVLCTLAMVLVAMPVLAEQVSAPGTSDGALSKALATNLYCSVYSLMGGNLGIILGLILVFLGLWAMIQGAKPIAVIPLIIVGALMTALPSLIESSLEGLATLFKEAGITKEVNYRSKFKQLGCGSSNHTSTNLTDAEMEARYRNNMGEPYPSRGSYENINSFGGNQIDFSSGSI